MRAMILAAGGAARLYPLTYTLPKPMVPVANIPVIEHLIRLLKLHGITEIMVNLHYLHRFITDYLDDGSRWGVHICYSYEPELLGTAGGVLQARDFFHESFLVIGGDDLTDMDLGALAGYHREKKALATIALYEAPQSEEYGVADIDGQGRILWFREKPKGEPVTSRWSNTGVYVFEPEIFNQIAEGASRDFGSELFPRLAEQKEAFYGYPVTDAYWCDIGDHLRYRQAHWDLLEGRTRILVPGDEVTPHVWIDAGAEVSPQAMVTPPVLIGRGARIGPDARVEGPVVLGPGVVVEPRARIHASIVWDRTQIQKECVVTDSLVGSSCVLESGHRYSKMVLASGARFRSGRESED
ncbi:MAG: NDP-sugar synthase [Armatimonadetes bacterium]|nr:NDP-sugar synthase [Armatimonadota bacterium]